MMMQLINNLKDTIIIKMAIGRENKNQQQNYVIIFSSPRRWEFLIVSVVGKYYFLYARFKL
jgi:hypothetical protein